jgi:hypothetical protein
VPSTLTLVPDERQPPDPEKQAGPEMRDAAPFIAWVEQRITTTDTELRRQARERGIEPPKDTGALEILLRDIAWTADGPRKRLYCWRRRQPGRGATLDERTGLFMASAEMIEAALEHAGVAVWEIYPEAGEADPDAQELFCPTCSDEVPVFDGRCGWCETAISRPRTQATGRPPRKPAGTPRKHTRRRRRKSVALKGLTPSKRPDLDSLTGEPVEPPGVDARRKGLPETFVREAMRLYLYCDLVLLDAARILHERHPGRWASPSTLSEGLRGCLDRRGVLLDIDGRTLKHNPQLLERQRERIEAYLETRDPGYAYQGKLPAELVWEAAYRYYLDGWGFNRTARRLFEVFPRIENTSAKSLGLTLHRVFKTNGWPARSQREATRATNWRHGMTAHRGDLRYERHRYRKSKGTQPLCDATCKTTGRPCGNYAMRGERKCFAHSERTRTEREAALARGHEVMRAELVDSTPFVAWLQGRVRQYGTQRAASEIVGIKADLLSQILRTGGTKNTPGKLTRGLIERSLAAALKNDPNLLVPRFSDLYDTTPATVVALAPPAPAPEVQAALAA